MENSFIGVNYIVIMEKLFEKQKTLNKSISIKGKGIHTGKSCSVRLIPSYDFGIVIKLNRNNRSFIFKICPDNVLDTKNQVSIGTRKYHLKLVEHILSSFHAIGITNCIIETDSDEIPGMDGSSYQFIKKILSVGIKTLDKTYEIINIPYPIWEVDNNNIIIILPDDYFSINCTVFSPYKSIATQSFNSIINENVYISEISKARTFGFIEDYEKLVSRGLCLGSSFDNTLALSKNKILSYEKRYNNEVVRHKVLDIIGDLYLLNRKINGKIIAYNSNHTLDFNLVKKIDLLINKSSPSKEEIKKQYEKFDTLVFSKKIFH